MCTENPFGKRKKVQNNAAQSDLNWILYTRAIAKIWVAALNVSLPCAWTWCSVQLNSFPNHALVENRLSWKQPSFENLQKLSVYSLFPHNSTLISEPKGLSLLLSHSVLLKVESGSCQKSRLEIPANGAALQGYPNPLQQQSCGDSHQRWIEILHSFIGSTN